MAAIGSAAELVNLLRKSGLVPPPALNPYVTQLEEGGTPRSAADLAKLLVRDGLLTRFQASRLMQGRAQGFFLGPYCILDQLGAGGMGAVFLARHQRLERLVALKVFPPEHANKPGALERFYREARAVAALDHPNIVRAHDVDSEGDRHFLVMEYVDGIDLQSLVDRHGPLAPARAAHYLGQAARALDHAHGQGMVHRDIKPGNLLLDRTGTVKVLDMGLAKFFNRAADCITQNLESQAIMGTADYMAPEQALGEGEVDIRADVYSLGCTGYFLLTGQPPFVAETTAQKLLAHQTQPPVPVAQRRPETPAALAKVIDRMLAKAPADRFPTPGAVAEALAPWLREPPPPPTAAELPSRGTEPAAGAASGTRRFAGAAKTTAPAKRRPAEATEPLPEAARQARRKEAAGGLPAWVNWAVALLALGILAVSVYLVINLATQAGNTGAALMEAIQAVKPAPDGSVTLSAKLAVVLGKTARYEGATDNIGFWSEPTDVVAWNVDVAKAGTYQIDLTWSCPADTAGTRCELLVGDQRLEFAVEATGADWQTYRTTKLGDLKLPTGRQRVLIKPLARPKSGVMNLKALHFAPQ